jgi:hypothetical protein
MAAGLPETLVQLSKQTMNILAARRKPQVLPSTRQLRRKLPERQQSDEAIAEHGGNARDAVKALLGKVAYLEAARDRAVALVSYGYARGRIG